ncbi:winged helix-turn-helix domain-containing protein [Blastococcus sp. CCUG 61487]|uniref:helix-turn-helix transcriptional regulator n=1 Tax=Blastococcus sp. CCUG 61487 TaxID=1840703 RepID=UPI0010C10403|nr:winged helix-turn-helix domain-containing protein [Blastococcus sp. CCUG 61487]TKJ28855.1 transcriptional regulator [Blastococcus sp. CCUG 61487]
MTASARSGGDGDAAGRPTWTFLTNHGHVLLAVAADGDARVEEIATTVGISTRAALSILRDLDDAGYLTRTRIGRRTHYELRPHQHFRHPATADHEVDELLAIFRPGGARG